METNIEPQHKFGVPDYLNADLYNVDQIIEAKITDFLGRRGSANPKGDLKWSAYLKVLGPDGIPQDFRLGIQNEMILAKKYGVKSYAELKGHTLQLQVKSYKFANGFILVGFK